MFVDLRSIEHVICIKVFPPRVKAFHHIEGWLEGSKYEFSKVVMVASILCNILKSIVHSCIKNFLFSIEKRLQNELVQSKLARNEVWLIGQQTYMSFDQNNHRDYESRKKECASYAFGGCACIHCCIIKQRTEPVMVVCSTSERSHRRSKVMTF